MSGRRGYTREMHELAKAMHARDAAAGTLKPPMAIAVGAGLGDCRRTTVNAGETTYQQYLPDARRLIRTG